MLTPDDMKQLERTLKALASAGKDRPPAYHEALNDVALAVGVIGGTPPERREVWTNDGIVWWAGKHHAGY